MPPVKAYDDVFTEALALPGGSALKAVTVVETEEQRDAVESLCKSRPTFQITSVHFRKEGRQRIPVAGDKGRTRIWRADTHGPSAMKDSKPPQNFKATRTTVLRFKVYKNYVCQEVWKQAITKPRVAFQCHVQSNGIEGVQDMWGFREEKWQKQDIFSAVVRIQTDNALAAIRRSGTSGIFVDPINWRDGNFMPYTTKWVETVPGENPLDYLARAQTLATYYGLTVGAKQLATRELKKDGEDDKIGRASSARWSSSRGCTEDRPTSGSSRRRPYGASTTTGYPSWTRISRS